MVTPYHVLFQTTGAVGQLPKWSRVSGRQKGSLLRQV